METRQIQLAVGVKADGIMGPDTLAAIKRFQSKNGLDPDGIVGKRTLAAIEIFLSGNDREDREDADRVLGLDTDLDLNGVPDVIDRIMLIPIIFESGRNLDAAWIACNRNGEWKGLFDKPKGLPPDQQDKKHWASRHNANGGTSIGLSYGFIQFTQDSGNLGQVLRTFHGIAGDSEMARTFGPNWKELLATTSASGSSRIKSQIDGSARSKRVQPVAVGDPGANGSDRPVDLWEEPWLARFRAAGRLPAMQAAQRAEAFTGFWSPARAEVDRVLGRPAKLSTVAVAYDVAVQFGVGGMKGRCPDVASSDEELVLGLISNLPADKRPRRKYVWDKAKAIEVKAG